MCSTRPKPSKKLSAHAEFIIFNALHLFLLLPASTVHMRQPQLCVRVWTSPPQQLRRRSVCVCLRVCVTVT